MSNRILIGSESRSSILKGINDASNIIKKTLGPSGRLALVDEGMSIRFTKDGVSVAKAIDLSDKSESIGVKLVQKVASKTVDTAGDGTTTSVVVFQSLVNNGMELIEAGLSSVEVQSGIRAALSHTEKFLGTITSEIKGDDKKIKQVATISANGEEEIGELISKAIAKIGTDGVIAVDDSKSVDTYLNVVEGMELERGYISSSFVNNQSKQTCELENPYVLIFDSKISNVNALIPVLEKVVAANRSMLIMSEDLEGTALAAIVLNFVRRTMKVAAIKLPGFGDNRKEVSKDIAVMTGGIVISEEAGDKLENVQLEKLGQAKKIIISKDKTTIIEGHGNEDEKQERVSLIKSERENSTSDYDKEKLQERVSKLTNGMAVINVGGATEVEQKERKDRVEDAVLAVKSALESGILPGGGSALAHASRDLEKLIEDSSLSTVEKEAVKAFQKAICAPMLQNIENSGSEKGLVFLNEVQSSSDKNHGYNVISKGYGSMIDLGILDPKKSTESAIKYACSIGIMFLTSGGSIVTLPEDRESNSMPSMDGMY
ncbi:chaperonin GroEL [Candidatus Nesciobacter abundans]|uniref:60 kDa chaperonin n=1 Tax=Candidatus Nesciobacter abundans TaxID=2601668 RepID=A0A5C0UH31_9PROT|nr:chaperonin GroEL [Candidatus Nesciobacter abundans]QEK39007.1 chaperonin GroEL [Candidatus Nesciobacter abundans]